MKTSIKLAFFSFLLIFLAACEETVFMQSDEHNISFGGIVVDGYISGATVCLDLNSNDLCDNSEPSTTSDENGIFSFSSRDFNDYAFIPVIAMGGVDTATQKEFTGELKSIIDAEYLAQHDSLIINPLTDLVAISFLRATQKDALALQSSIKEVADVFELNETDVLKDPMQDVHIFVKVQEVQHLKTLIETSATKTYVVESSKDLTKEIKKALVTQIEESQNGLLNLERVLETVEIELNIVIPQNERVFILDQIQEINRALGVFVADDDIDINNLGRLQLALENELEEAYVRLANADDINTSIEIIDINITYAFITQSIFNKTDAILDEQACLEDEGYKILTDTSFSPERTNDLVNGISINSDYPFNSDLELTEVQIYYTSLEVEKMGQNTILFTDDYYFAFDEAWVENPEHTIYIRTPKDGNNLYGCYRAELNTTVASDIALTKVFRYSDI